MLLFRSEFDGSRNYWVPPGEIVRTPHHQIPTDFLPAQQEVKEVERRWPWTAKAEQCCTCWGLEAHFFHLSCSHGTSGWSSRPAPNCKPGNHIMLHSGLYIKWGVLLQDLRTWVVTLSRPTWSSTSAKIFLIMVFRTMLTVPTPNQHTYRYQR